MSNQVITITEAKTNLSKLVALARQGKTTIIGRAGEAEAELVPIQKKKFNRKPGAWKGKVIMAPDFDETPQEFLDAYYGK